MGLGIWEGDLKPLDGDWSTKHSFPCFSHMRELSYGGHAELETLPGARPSIAHLTIAEIRVLQMHFKSAAMGFWTKWQSAKMNWSTLNPTTVQLKC